MKFLLKAVLIWAVSVTSLQAQAQDRSVTVRGAPSCGKWIEVRKNQPYSPESAWLIGYLSGTSSGLGVDALKGTDNDSLFLWMDNYCKTDPLSHLGRGANSLFIELMKKNNLSLPK